MKKLLLTLLISLNLAMPAHAVIFVAGTIGGPTSIPIMIISFGAFISVMPSSTDDVSTLEDLLPLFLLTAIQLLDGEKNSEDNLIQVRFDILKDIEALIANGIYTEIEGNTLKSEWNAFNSENKIISVYPEDLQGMSPEQVVARIHSEVGINRNLLAEYFASKMGIQVQ